VIRSTSRLWMAIAVSFTASLFGCSGPPVPATISGEPVCADYTIGTGGGKLRGGLRYPVKVTILDDDDPVTKAIIYGKRAEGDPSPKIVLPDKNAEYKVEWAQCGNEHATAAVTAPKAKSLRTDSSTIYDCGTAETYKTATLVTKKGDPASHALAYEAPPKPECWMDAKPEEGADAGAADATAPEAEATDAGAADADVADANAGDAEAPDAEAPDAAGNADAAPAKESGDKPAEKAPEKPAEKAPAKPAEKKPAEKKPAEVRADDPSQ
jgi:hypothetical protein